MKLSVDAVLLSQCLRAAARVVPATPTLPVLGNVLLKAENGTLQCIATNLDLSIITQCPAHIDTPGAITVPAKTISSYVSLTTDKEEIQLEVKKGTSLQMKTKGSKIDIKGIAADEYPRVDTTVEGSTHQCSASAFQQAVQQVAFCANERSARPLLSGVYMRATTEQMTWAATDSYRLAEKRLPLEQSSAEASCIVPVRTLYEAVKSLSGASTITLTISENQLSLQLGDTTLVSRLINGQFPDYQRIIPHDHSNALTISREEIDHAVRQGGLFAGVVNQQLFIDIDSSGKTTIATDSTESGQSEATCQGTLQGPGTRVSVNKGYLTDSLNSLTGLDTLVLHLGDSSEMKAITITPKGDDSLLQLIMPLKA
ncbi:DNA polymerase III subunit beta [Candidatus Peribacteria bacterium]|nr:DNA polymerase III subunit beta [Candidatus Peribacteria bacterium]